LGAERGLAPRRQIVFEGSQPADLEQNATLQSLLSTGEPPTAPRVPTAWLGEPLAIQDATAATFPKRAAANLLWLGQNDEAAAGMLLGALVGLAAQLPPRPVNGGEELPQFYVLDGGSADGPQRAMLRKLAAALPRRVRLADLNEVASVVGLVAAEVQRRAKA